MRQTISELARIIAKHATVDGVLSTNSESVKLVRASTASRPTPQLFEAGLVIAAQGRKTAYLDGNAYEYGAGKILAVFIPIVVECSVLEASPEEPFLALAVPIDRNRMTDMLVRIGRHSEPEKVAQRPVGTTGIICETAHEEVIETACRLARTLDRPLESSLLTDSIIEELYFRILCDQYDGGLLRILDQRGQIQQIAGVIDSINQRIDDNYTVDQLAKIASMSVSGLHKKFKEVMHQSPLQYAKSVKLQKARLFIGSGKNITEASRLVGYNSASQFSREFKKMFGVPPSSLSPTSRT